MRKTLHQGKYLHLLSDHGWEYVERLNITGIVGILAITDDGKLVLVEQYRKPVQKKVIELPAGLAGDIEGEEDEPLSNAAQRELVEETGYWASQMKFLGIGPTSAGLTNEAVSLFRATGLEKRGEGGGDESESIIVHEVPLDRVHEWLDSKIKEDYLVDFKVYAGLYFAHRP